MSEANAALQAEVTALQETNALARERDALALDRIREGAGLSVTEWTNERIKAAKNMYCNNAPSMGHVIEFFSVCRRLDHDPALGGLWLVDLGRQGWKILVGVDLMRKKARQHPEYAGLESDVVYSSDEFDYERTESGIKFRHKITSHTDRGDLVLAYAFAKRKGFPDVPRIARWKDYSHLISSKDNWKKYGPDMLTARAESAAIRRQFGMEGLYVREEFSDDDVNAPLATAIAGQTKAAIAAELLPGEAAVVDGGGEPRKNSTEGTEMGPEVSAPDPVPDAPAEDEGPSESDVEEMGLALPEPDLRDCILRMVTKMGNTEAESPAQALMRCTAYADFTGHRSVEKIPHQDYGTGFTQLNVAYARVVEKFRVWEAVHEAGSLEDGDAPVESEPVRSKAGARSALEEMIVEANLSAVMPEPFMEYVLDWMVDTYVTKGDQEASGDRRNLTAAHFESIMDDFENFRALMLDQWSSDEDSDGDAQQGTLV